MLRILAGLALGDAQTTPLHSFLKLPYSLVGPLVAGPREYLRALPFVLQVSRALVFGPHGEVVRAWHFRAELFSSFAARRLLFVHRLGVLSLHVLEHTGLILAHSRRHFVYQVSKSRIHLEHTFLLKHVLLIWLGDKVFTRCFQRYPLVAARVQGLGIHEDLLLLDCLVGCDCRRVWVCLLLMDGLQLGHRN